MCCSLWSPRSPPIDSQVHIQLLETSEATRPLAPPWNWLALAACAAGITRGHLLPARPELLPGQDQPPSPCVPGLPGPHAASGRTHGWMTGRMATQTVTACHPGKCLKCFVFNKTSGPKLFNVLCDNHVPGVPAQMTRPVAQGQQGEGRPGPAGARPGLPALQLIEAGVGGPPDAGALLPALPLHQLVVDQGLLGQLGGIQHLDDLVNDFLQGEGETKQNKFTFSR